VYSLVSASVLAIDLARHPSGAAVADVTDRVLALTPGELAGFGPPAPGDARARVRAAVADAPRMSTLMGGVAATVAEGLPSAQVSLTVLEALAQTLLGGLDDLLALLAAEPPLAGADPAAVQVALDAVTVAWAGREADLADLSALHAPWAAALDPVPPALPPGPGSTALGALLDEVSRRSPEQWQRVARAHAGRERGLGWSTSMHTACRAAFDAGRLVEVARAQLAAARVLRLSGASTGPQAHAVAMAVTSAVQAACTQDLLEPPVTLALTCAWSAGS
jgi:hypothetical protein